MNSLLALCLATVPNLHAGGAHAQQEGRSMKAVRVEAGYSVNHRGADAGIGGSVRFVLSNRGNDAIRQEAGLILGSPYLGLDYGVELRFPRETPLGVLIRVGLGLLLEDGQIGPHVRGGGGVEWTLSPRIALRFTGQAGYHIGSTGPHMFYAGIDYRY